ncbi:hypothetical protein EVG20_g4102 [Dentipellis fragilis]|uniref:Uncharacterized protein n=1 Tax=Dentipellis fragilis TaxID=205917 RepID=A0A4Y9YWM4_9AGAM|nr:hypothetical protein EVG20_g4102 [Dentipellis fragilis]
MVSTISSTNHVRISKFHPCPAVRKWLAGFKGSRSWYACALWASTKSKVARAACMTIVRILAYATYVVLYRISDDPYTKVQLPASCLATMLLLSHGTTVEAWRPACASDLLALRMHKLDGLVKGHLMFAVTEPDQRRRARCASWGDASDELQVEALRLSGIAAPALPRCTDRTGRNPDALDACFVASAASSTQTRDLQVPRIFDGSINLRRTLWVIGYSPNPSPAPSPSASFSGQSMRPPSPSSCTLWLGSRTSTIASPHAFAPRIRTIYPSASSIQRLQSFTRKIIGLCTIPHAQIVPPATLSPSRFWCSTNPMGRTVWPSTLAGCLQTASSAAAESTGLSPISQFSTSP